MKRSMLLTVAVIISLMSYAQPDYMKRPSVGIHFSLTDFQGAATLRGNGIANLINSKQFFKLKRMDPGLAISYTTGATQHIDINAEINGSFLQYPTSDFVHNNLSSTKDNLLLEAAVTANFKLLTDRYIVVPFITGGLGASKYKGYYGAFIPIGIGAQIKLAEGTFLVANSQYRISATENVAYHFFHSIGVIANITKKKVVVIAPPPPPPAPPVVDRDGDGVLDVDDKCPDTPGLASLQGCPDRDGDGIADKDDKCPDTPGLAKYQGCPIPDTDGDGINDELDKCPTVKGFARYQGCPIPDTDGDGVNDEEDKCPSRPGPASNMGCPVIAKEVVDKINFAAKNVFFSTGSFKLLPKSFKSLDVVADLLKADNSLMIDIDGHTDSQGKPDKNQILSENRAKSVADYLVKKGIDASRLKSTGYGDTKPVADNKTAAGRAKNRRTEMTVRNY
jgi:OOP family OmpA-OmpF porin